ncbi:ATP-binding protein [Paratractidigestivibacter sp.]|uniref:ATP-binding protein n=1 Tax=Paratractidigestivibacter sp. TaxID=2847316 RepID=UPI002ABD358C|nr:ATP-binding protein [Paratractidigestivibacter sp.]
MTEPTTTATEDELREEGLHRAYTAIAQIYLSMHRVDVARGTYETIKATDAIRRFEADRSGNFAVNSESIVRGLAEEESYQNAMEFLDLSTIADRMAGSDHISTQFTGKVAGNCKLHFIKEDTDAAGKPLHVIFAVEVADADKLSQVFDVLARNFQNVFWIDLVGGMAKVLKLDGYITKGLDRNDHQYFPYPTVLNNYIDDRVHPDEREALCDAIGIEGLREAFLEQGKSELVGNYRILVDGEVHNFQYNYFKMDDEGFVVCGFQNIDAIIEETLAKERELIEARDEADRANNAKTEFLLRMSHDIRTPLNGIVGMLDIADRFPDDPARQADCREKIRESSKVLLELINEVLDMNKLESGEIVLEHVPFDLTDVARDVYYALAKQAEERDISIVQVDCAVPHARLVGSPTHLKSVIMNIMSNAVKYNKDHGKISITCTETEAADGMVELVFICSDTGIGMSREFQEHIFDPFAQEQASPRTRYPGTGLGMSITKSIVDKMGGTIEFSSAQGEGTTFTVRVPLEIDKSACAASAVDEASEQASIDKMTLLLVEDNDLNLEIAQFLLEEEGAKVEVARDGQEAVDVFTANEPGHFDAILMDIMMPVMDGYDAARAIRALAREDAASVPIIAMTANAFAEDKLRAREAGMDEHVAKPLDIDLLVQTIDRLAGRK